MNQRDQEKILLTSLEIAILSLFVHEKILDDKTIAQKLRKLAYKLERS